MNLTASLSLQVLCQLIRFQAPYSNDANIVISNPPEVSNPPAISNLPEVSTQSPPPVQPTTLPDGYIAHPEIGAAYKIVLDTVRWSKARRQCNLEGARLAILDSQKKLEYALNTTCHTHDCTRGWINIHTGIYRMDEEWVDSSTGETLSNLIWRVGYPTDSPHHCAIAEFLGADKKSYLHHWVGCNKELFYLCEVPIPKDHKTQENQMAQVSVN